MIVSSWAGHQGHGQLCAPQRKTSFVHVGRPDNLGRGFGRGSRTALELVEQLHTLASQVGSPGLGLRSHVRMVLREGGSVDCRQCIIGEEVHLESCHLREELLVLGHQVLDGDLSIWPPPSHHRRKGARQSGVCSIRLLLGFDNIICFWGRGAVGVRGRHTRARSLATSCACRRVSKSLRSREFSSRAA